jgi:hypothetical protein
LEAIASLFKRENKEVPKLIKITYYPSTQKMNTDFSYDNRLIGTELMGEDLVMQWIEELKK